MRSCFFGKSVLFIQERKRNRSGLFVCLSILGNLRVGVRVECGAEKLRELRESSSAGRRHPLPQPARSPPPAPAAAQSRSPSRRVWAVRCVGGNQMETWTLTLPGARARAHSQTHTHIRPTSATHYPSSAYTHPHTPYATHIPLDSARVCACLKGPQAADRAPYEDTFLTFTTHQAPATPPHPCVCTSYRQRSRCTPGIVPHSLA